MKPLRQINERVRGDALAPAANNGSTSFVLVPACKFPGCRLRSHSGELHTRPSKNSKAVCVNKSLSEDITVLLLHNSRTAPRKLKLGSGIICLLRDSTTHLKKTAKSLRGEKNTFFRSSLRSLK